MNIKEIETQDLPAEKQQLRGLALYEAIRDKLKFISDYRAKGGTLEEL